MECTRPHINFPATPLLRSSGGWFRGGGSVADILAAAIEYARRGWIVHRLSSPTSRGKSPGKRPIDDEWQKVTAPPTEAQLTQWFGNGNPKGYNIGISCGEASGVTVIDLDRRIYADIFNGVDTLRSSRTAGRSHVYFMYTPRLKATKHHNLGIEILSNGSNAVLPPSTHESGDTYKWNNPEAPLTEMPEEIEVKLLNLFEREKELNALVRKCRPCFTRLFTKEIREATDFHGAEGRELMVAWGADLRAAEATLADAEMWAKILYGDGFDRSITLTEWRNIDPAKTWKCETVAAKLGGVIDCDCAGCKWRAPTAPEATQTDIAPMADMSSTDRLIELGKQDAVFFHTPDDTCYAAIKLETGGSAIYPVNEKSRQFRRILKHRYYRATGKAPAGEPLKAAIGVLESIATFEGATVELHNRVAWHDGNICYDLTNSNYEAIEVTPQGWDLMPHGHTLFRRYAHQIPQAKPIPGGNPWRLYDFMNIEDDDRILDMVYLIACLVPEIPHPISITTGEHGSAKTTACKMRKALVDPSDLEVLALPTNDDRMLQMLHHHWFAPFDNVTYLQRWQSDALCRACTGEGSAKRTLYTDGEDTIIKYKRCVGLNGINNAAMMPDLLDRAIFLNHEPIHKDRRIEERVLFRQFNEAKPEILGGMLDALSGALQIYPTIELEEKKRMADFAVWGSAIAEALGCGQEEFLNVYYENIDRINRTALEESPVGMALLTFMENIPEWNGTPSLLLRELDLTADGLYIDKKSNAWVKRPESLGKRLKLIMPNLREEGITVEMARSNSERTIRITNHKFNYEKKPSQPSQPSPNRRSIADNVTKPNRHQLSQPSLDRPNGDSSTDPVTVSDGLSFDTNQQQKPLNDGCDGCDGFSYNIQNRGTCGKCGRELSGQTFRGAAGLGMICADCQVENDRISGLGATTDEKLLTFVRSAIYQITSSDRPTFDPAAVLMKMKGRADDATIGRVIACLDTHADNLKIARLPNGRYRKVST